LASNCIYKNVIYLISAGKKPEKSREKLNVKLHSTKLYQYDIYDRKNNIFYRNMSESLGELKTAMEMLLRVSMFP